MFFNINLMVYILGSGGGFVIYKLLMQVLGTPFVLINSKGDLVVILLTTWFILLLVYLIYLCVSFALSTAIVAFMFLIQISSADCTGSKRAGNSIYCCIKNNNPQGNSNLQHYEGAIVNCQNITICNDPNYCKNSCKIEKVGIFTTKVDQKNLNKLCIEQNNEFHQIVPAAITYPAQNKKIIQAFLGFCESIISNTNAEKNLISLDSKNESIIELAKKRCKENSERELLNRFSGILKTMTVKKDD